VAADGGRLSVYDDPMWIADAALYLRQHDSDLGIGNIYELDRDQFDAAVALLQQQRPAVGTYWSNSAQNARGFAVGRANAGTGWQVTINQLLADGVKIRAGLPEEGVTGISDSWMISSHAPHPNCMYEWMGYTTGASANARLAEQTAQAPANEHACDLTRDPAWCDNYRAADEQLFGQVRFWQTPMRDCGDDRGDSCMDYADWSSAFDEVRAR
jgi:putative spermidine/putrescine transport system substrate-binding protein